jgi:two-component system, LytTR family, sensor kinase
MFATKYRYGLMILLGGYSFLNTLVVESFEHYPIVTSQSTILLLFVVLIAGIWEGNRLLDAYLGQQRIRRFWKRIAYQFGGSIVLTFVLTMLLGGLTCYYTVSPDWRAWVLPMKLLLMINFRINLFLNTIHVIFLYNQQLEKSRQEIQSYKRISGQAQLQSLKNQVNPHFLFNNLSVLSALIPTDATASVEFVRQFSRVYRYVLKSHEKELVPLSEELSFVESYLFLLRTRFESGLHVEVNVSEQCLEKYVLPVSVQMLVENAVKHNVVAKSRPLHVEIISLNDQSITVRNNLQTKPVEEEDSTKLGLSNINKRYQFLGRSGIAIEQSSDTFSVTIPLIQLQEAKGITRSVEHAGQSQTY